MLLGAVTVKVLPHFILLAELVVFAAYILSCVTATSFAIVSTDRLHRPVLAQSDCVTVNTLT